MCLTCCVGLCCASAVADAEGSSSSVEGPLSSSLVSAGSPVQGEESQAQLQAELAGPQAVAAREASSTQFEGLDARRAASVDGEAFPALIDEPDGGPPRLAGGQRVTGFVNAYTAQTSLGGGEAGLVQSLLPMAIATSGSVR
jgi:hypothetical protein